MHIVRSTIVAVAAALALTSASFRAGLSVAAGDDRGAVRAGGSVDIVGRLVAQKLTERLGKPFIVENRPGAGTATATTAVAKSAPDGHTLLFAPSGTYAINPTLYKQLAYDPLKDLTMVALVTRDPLVLVVNPSLPVKSVADLVKYAKDNPGKVSFASTGPGTSLTLLGELLKFTAKIDIVSVGYRERRAGPAGRGRRDRCR